jgi:protein-disulfide isomerase
MASRTRQKEEARARRIAEKQARSERDRRQRRTRMLAGVLIAAVAVVGIAIAVSSGGGTGKAPSSTGSAARGDAAAVNSLLAGIPQRGDVLGNPGAKVTVTEYGDLECSICDEFALPTGRNTLEGGAGTGYLDTLISTDVRSGKVKLVYRALETASSQNPDSTAFLRQQTAAKAAGLQNKEWSYVELMYYEQGPEGADYVTPAYLDGLAKQIPGLNYSAWQSNLGNSSLEAQVTSDNNAGVAVDGGSASTPTIVASGPLGQAKPIVGLPGSYSELTAAIQSVT